MKAREAKLWLKALRSGKYLQGDSVLARKDTDGNVKYCCLGVLCEVARSDGVNIAVSTDEHDEITYDGEYSAPPKSVLDWAGISDNEHDDRGDSLTFIEKCIHWNDSKEYSFRRIAGFVDRMKHDK